MSELIITLIGGPTALIEAGGFRLLTDPTFDPPGEYQLPHVTLKKLAGPARTTTQIGQVDALGVRSLDDPRCFLSSALLLHRLGQLATRAVEDVNLGHVFEVELMYQTHRAAAARAR